MELPQGPAAAAAPGTRRKLSIPLNLTVPGATGNSSADQPPLRRRFSNVGDAVSRKLSTTIGWRSNTVGGPPEEIVAIGRGLGALYLRHRLKRAGVFNRKLGLTRVRSTLGPLGACGALVRDIFPGLSCACSELERMHPKLYSKIARQTGPTLGGGVSGLLLAVGHHLLRSEPTWGKVIAIYSVAGGLAVDSVRSGQEENIHAILEDLTELLEEKMANWIQANGGWAGLNSHCHQQDQGITMIEYAAIFALFAIILLVAYLVVKFCAKLGI